jgi:hypothetical protein
VTEATLVLLLLQVPPVAKSVKVVVAPSHTELAPSIVFNAGLTVTIAVLTHPPSEYEMVAVPVATPVTIPEEMPTVAFPVLLLDQTPPDGVDDNAVVDPTHTLSVPDIEDGIAVTVTTAV